MKKIIILFLFALPLLAQPGGEDRNPRWGFFLNGIAPLSTTDEVMIGTQTDQGAYIFQVIGNSFYVGDITILTGTGGSATDSSWVFTNTAGMPELNGYGTDGDNFITITGNISDHALFKNSTLYSFDNDLAIPATKTLFLDGGNGTGFRETSDNDIGIILDSGVYWQFTTGGLYSGTNGRPYLKYINAAGTTPNILPKREDENTGFTSVTLDSAGVTAGGILAMMWGESGGTVTNYSYGNLAMGANYISNDGGAAEGMSFDTDGNATLSNDLTIIGFNLRSYEAGITASTTQSQGQQPLTKDINEIATVANANDVVTLPSAVAGMEIFIKNNGVNTLQIFPASGDDLGAGVDTSTTLISGGKITFVAYDTTNWEVK